MLIYNKPMIDYPLLVLMLAGSLHDTSRFVSSVERHQGLQIAFQQGFSSSDDGQSLKRVACGDIGSQR